MNTPITEIYREATSLPPSAEEQHQAASQQQQQFERSEAEHIAREQWLGFQFTQEFLQQLIKRMQQIDEEVATLAMGASKEDILLRKLLVEKATINRITKIATKGTDKYYVSTNNN